MYLHRLRKLWQNSIVQAYFINLSLCFACRGEPARDYRVSKGKGPALVAARRYRSKHVKVHEKSQLEKTLTSAEQQQLLEKHPTTICTVQGTELQTSLLMGQRCVEVEGGLIVPYRTNFVAPSNLYFYII